MFFQPGMSHSYAFFICSFFFLVWLKPMVQNGRIDWGKATDRSLRKSFFLGVLLGLGFIVRYLDGLLTLFLVFECIFLLISFKSGFSSLFRRIVPVYLMAFIGFAFVAGLQFWVQYLKHGSFSILDHYDGGFDQSTGILKWLEVLFSSHHGLFYWHPLLMLGFLGCGWSIVTGDRAWRMFGLCTLAVLLIYAVVVASWGRFAFGANSFGHRFFISLYPAIFLFTSYFLNSLGKCLKNGMQIAVFVVVILCLLAFNASIMLQFAIGIIPPDGPVSWAEMMANTWTELPHEISRRLGR
jgi:hypothetical protein